MNYGKWAFFLSILGLAVVLIGNPLDHFGGDNAEPADNSQASSDPSLVSQSSSEGIISSQPEPLTLARIQLASQWAAIAALSERSHSSEVTAWIKTVPNGEQIAERDLKNAEDLASTVLEFSGLSVSNEVREAFLQHAPRAATDWSMQRVSQGSQTYGVADGYMFHYYFLDALTHPEEFCAEIVMSGSAANPNICYPGLRPPLGNGSDSPTNPYVPPGNQPSNDSELYRKQLELEQAEEERRRQEKIDCLNWEIEAAKDTMGAPAWVPMHCSWQTGNQFSFDPEINRKQLELEQAEEERRRQEEIDCLDRKIEAERDTFGAPSWVPMHCSWQ